MRVKVMKTFRDKYTKKVYKPGEVLNLKKDRVDEILAVGKDLIEQEKKSK